MSDWWGCHYENITRSGIKGGSGKAEVDGFISKCIKISTAEFPTKCIQKSIAEFIKMSGQRKGNFTFAKILELEQWRKGEIQYKEVIDVETGHSSHSTVSNASGRKRSKTGTVKSNRSNLAISHEQNQAITKVKHEKVAAETALDDVREDLDIANETVMQQTVFTDNWQSRFDELALLAEAAGVERSLISELRHRSHNGGSR